MNSRSGFSSAPLRSRSASTSRDTSASLTVTVSLSLSCLQKIQVFLKELVPCKQCCGSVTFWYRYGSGDPNLWLTGPDPDPAIFSRPRDLQDAPLKIIIFAAPAPPGKPPPRPQSPSRCLSAAYRKISVPDPWHFGTDSDPGISTSD